MAYTDAQKKAIYAYRKRNREKVNYINRKSDAKSFIEMAEKGDLEEMKEMIDDRMAEETTYIVVVTTKNSDDEWVEYEGFDKEKAIEAYKEYKDWNKDSNYDVEIRVMCKEYNQDPSIYNYSTLEKESEMKNIKDLLQVKNLYFSVANSDGTMDLEFKVDGKTVFARSVPIDDPSDEFYWDDEENVAKAVEAAKEIEII